MRSTLLLDAGTYVLQMCLVCACMCVYKHETAEVLFKPWSRLDTRRQRSCLVSCLTQHVQIRDDPVQMRACSVHTASSVAQQQCSAVQYEDRSVVKCFVFHVCMRSCSPAPRPTGKIFLRPYVRSTRYASMMSTRYLVDCCTSSRAHWYNSRTKHVVLIVTARHLVFRCVMTSA